MLPFQQLTCRQLQPRLGTHALVRHWANVSSQKPFHLSSKANRPNCGPWFIRLTALFSPAGLDFAQCCHWEAAEHLCEKHLHKERRGREEHFRLGKIGFIELEVEKGWADYPVWTDYRNNTQTKDNHLTQLSQQSQFWKTSDKETSFLKNPQDINCIFVCCIKKTNVMTTAQFSTNNRPINTILVL